MSDEVMESPILGYRPSDAAADDIRDISEIIANGINMDPMESLKSITDDLCERAKESKRYGNKNNTGLTDEDVEFICDLLLDPMPAKQSRITQARGSISVDIEEMVETIQFLTECVSALRAFSTHRIRDLELDEKDLLFGKMLYPHLVNCMTLVTKRNIALKRDEKGKAVADEQTTPAVKIETSPDLSHTLSWFVYYLFWVVWGIYKIVPATTIQAI